MTRISSALTWPEVITDVLSAVLVVFASGLPIWDGAAVVVDEAMPLFEGWCVCGSWDGAALVINGVLPAVECVCVDGPGDGSV